MERDPGQEGETIAAEPRAEILLEATALSRSFAGRSAPALDGVDFRARAGRITGIVGPDGAGKTTLLRVAAGLLKPHAGSIRVLGAAPGAAARAGTARIGYMPQRFGLYEDLGVAENLDLFADLQGLPFHERAERFAELLELTDLGDFRARRAGRLSGGMKQKLGLACSLLVRPRLLLLDEPTVGVDPVSRRDLWRILDRLVAAEGIGVVIATAYLDEADRCAEVLVLDRGRVVACAEPATLRHRVAGRVRLVEPRPGCPPRVLQARLEELPEVRDCSIRKGRLRCLLDQETAAVDRLIEGLPEVASSAVVEPTFEDAFMAMQESRPDRAGAATPIAGLASAADEAMIAVEGLGKRFGDFVAVSAISFTVRRGEIFGLLGPNGAGKTTTFRMLCGLLPASDGEIRVAGRDLRRAPGRARAGLGYMAQAFSLYPHLTIVQNLRFFGRSYGLGGRRLRRRIEEVLDEFDLRARRDEDAGKIPAGFQRRLSMAAAVLHEPEILFLDEPTSGADPLARREFWARISAFAARGMTIVVTTHFMEEVESCDQVLLMSRGRELARGSPDEIRALARGPKRPDPGIEDAFIALSEGEVVVGAAAPEARP
ncbi:MAG: ABC transporter ATP-binding protein [Planctomycetes bacterium]|nr:ABC transporter ATP-binding protein [Planctomycetota bacterium]